MGRCISCLLNETAVEQTRGGASHEVQVGRPRVATLPVNNRRRKSWTRALSANWRQAGASGRREGANGPFFGSRLVSARAFPPVGRALSTPNAIGSAICSVLQPPSRAPARALAGSQ